MIKRTIYLSSDCGPILGDLIQHWEGIANIKQVESTQFVKSVLEHNENGVFVSKNSLKSQIMFNKFEDIRAAICYNQYMAAMCREHNNANIMIIPLDYVSEKVALNLVSDFLNAEFDTKTTPNHERRVNKLKLRSV